MNQRRKCPLICNTINDFDVALGQWFSTRVHEDPGGHVVFLGVYRHNITNYFHSNFGP